MKNKLYLRMLNTDIFMPNFLSLVLKVVEISAFFQTDANGSINSVSSPDQKYI